MARDVALPYWLQNVEYMLCYAILAQGNSGFDEKFLLLFV